MPNYAQTVSRDELQSQLQSIEAEISMAEMFLNAAESGSKFVEHNSLATLIGKSRLAYSYARELMELLPANVDTDQFLSRLNHIGERITQLSEESLGLEGHYR